MKTGQLKTRAQCPQCARTLDGWSHEEDAPPTKGDLTVCVYCHAVLQFTKKLKLKPATAKAIAEVDFIELQHAQKSANRWPSKDK